MKSTGVVDVSRQIDRDSIVPNVQVEGLVQVKIKTSPVVKVDYLSITGESKRYL